MKSGQVWLLDFEPQIGQEVKKSDPPSLSVKNLSIKRFAKKIGILNKAEMTEVKICLAKVLELL